MRHYESIKEFLKQIIRYRFYLYTGYLIFLLFWVLNNKPSKQIIRLVPTKTEQFSETALINLLKKSNIRYPHIVLAQARLESGHYKSKVFKENHNMFGMRKAAQRITSAKGSKNTYAYYRDWVDCVYDYAMYQNSFMKNVNSEEEYFARLSASYAQDSAYSIKLKRIIRNEKLKDMF